MFRFTPRSLFAFVLLLLSFTAVHAQGANVPAQAVVSYANLLTPEAVTELQATYTEVDDLAFATLDRYVAGGVVAPEIADAMKLALTTGTLPYEAFIIYLADVVNGADPTPATLEIAEALLVAAGIRLPVADANGNITAEALADAPY